MKKSELALRIEPDLLERVRKFAERNDYSQSQAIRKLLAQALRDDRDQVRVESPNG